MRPARHASGPAEPDPRRLLGSAAVRVIPVRALIFDMDGTMIDSMGHHRLSWLEFARRHRLEIDVEDLMRRTTGRTGAECMDDLFGREFSRDESWALIAEKERIYRELFAPVFREVAGFCAFAAQAHALGLRIGVGTAGDRHNIAFAMQHLAMDPAPQAVVGGDEGLPGKPEPAIFLEVARRLGVAPEHCVVFEDAPFGIEAARRAGMAAVAVCSSHSAADLAGPHVLAAFDNFNSSAAAALLQRLND
jgi:beta-phosphoglucomutase-like phosphatase (HAD superfamily)